MALSTTELMVIAGWNGKFPPTPTIMTSPAACASDHLQKALILTLRNERSGRAKEVFLPTPHRIKFEAGKTTEKLYVNEFPKLLAKNLRACGSNVTFDAYVHDMQTQIYKDLMMKVKQSRSDTNMCGRRQLTAWRNGNQSREKALSADRKAANWMENRRIDHEIKRLERAQAHLRRQVNADNLRKDANSLFIA